MTASAESDSDLSSSLASAVSAARVSRTNICKPSAAILASMSFSSSRDACSELPEDSSSVAFASESGKNSARDIPHSTF